MFTGIIETTGEVTLLRKEEGNLHITLRSALSAGLKVDQSLAHNGVCLTVVETGNETYTVTAIEETLRRSNLGQLRPGDAVNLERSLLMNGRLDGHIVQGHVDQVGICTAVEPEDGSHLFRFEYDASGGNVTVKKGSVCVNGVSLTVVDSGEGSFSVAVIPYTFEHTNFSILRPGDPVNLEFDIIGKYVSRLIGK